MGLNVRLGIWNRLGLIDVWDGRGGNHSLGLGLRLREGRAPGWGSEGLQSCPKRARPGEVTSQYTS